MLFCLKFLPKCSAQRRVKSGPFFPCTAGKEKRADLGYWQKFCFLFCAEIVGLTTNELSGLKCKDQLLVRRDNFWGVTGVKVLGVLFSNTVRLQYSPSLMPVNSQ